MSDLRNPNMMGGCEVVPLAYGKRELLPTHCGRLARRLDLQLREHGQAYVRLFRAMRRTTRAPSLS